MILIYGAYGYTGKLIIDEALKNNLKITIAGRNANKVEALASEKNVPGLALTLEDTQALEKHLQNFELVIHCAGPFEYTAKPMAEACIAAKTHYLDITGEYQVFEDLHHMHAAAQQANVMLLPGAGFDVVPSDCLSAQLKQALPDGKVLKLAFTSTAGSLSRGTAKTMIENLDKGQYYRENNHLASKKMGKSVRNIDFGAFSQIAVGISWGDISSAYFSTGIPNIEVFTGSTNKQIKQMKWTNFLKPLLRMRWVKNYLQKQLDKKPAGPSQEKRAKGEMYLWGQLSNGKDVIEKRLKTPNGYSLTALTSVEIAKRILNKNYKPGYQTPSTAYGADFIFDIPGCEALG